MNGLPDVLGRPWRDLVNDSNPPDEGFEAQFSWIRSQTAYSNDLLQIEKLIVEYFEVSNFPIIRQFMTTSYWGFAQKMLWRHSTGTLFCFWLTRACCTNPLTPRYYYA